MATRATNSKSVFVGNIPYDATEKELIDIFSEVGRVVSFRLVEDRDTKKPRGYGFCEYLDQETAQSAIRNLNNRELNKRVLRVSNADNEKANEMASAMGIGIVPLNSNESFRSIGGGYDQMGSAPNQPQQPIQPQQQQQQPPPNQQPIQQQQIMMSQQQQNQQPNQQPQQKDGLQTIIENTNVAQLFDVMSKMKQLIQQNPENAKQMLVSNPQLSLALLHAQVVLGMINQNTVQQLIAMNPKQQMNQQPPSYNQQNVPPGMFQPPQQNPQMGGGMSNPQMGGGMSNPMNRGQPQQMVGGMMQGNMGPMQGQMGGMNPNNPQMGGGMNNPQMGGGMMQGNMGPMQGQMGGMNPNNPQMGGGMNNPQMSGGMNNPNPQMQPNIPPPPNISPAAMNNWNQLSAQHRQFVHYVLNLTPQQFQQEIPPGNREKVLNIINLYRGGN